MPSLAIESDGRPSARRIWAISRPARQVPPFENFYQRSNVIERDHIMRHRYTKEKLFRWNTVATDAYLELQVDCVIEAIGDVVQPLGDLEVTSWQSLKADLETGRVPGRQIWIAGQALTQKGKIRDSYVSALQTVTDMGPWLYPQSWETRHLLRTLMHHGRYGESEAPLLH